MDGDRFKIEEGWSTLLLVWGMVFVGAVAIRQANLIDGLEILGAVVTVAVLAGLVLAKSKFTPLNAHLFSLVYGLALATFLIGRTLPGDLTWQARIFELVDRQAAWAGKVFTEETSRDGLIFVMHTAAVYWLLGYTAAWFTFRKPRIWLAVIPAGLVLLSVVYYYFGPAQLGLYLALYMLLALIYIARTYLERRERHWISAAIRYERGIRGSFLRASFVVSLLALVVAWSLPALPASASAGAAFNDISSPWRRFQDDWTRLFSALRSYGVGTNDPYSSSLTLGGPRNVGNTVVMDVFVGEEVPNVYWQGLALDRYEGGRWSLTNSTTILHYPEDGALAAVQLEARREITQTVVNFIPNSGIMYTAPEVVATDRQMYVTQQNPDSSSPEVVGVKSRYVMRQNDVYNVVSRISEADADGLRAAAVEYPEWVRALYLQVPEELTPETLELAESITAPFDNPFDKAIAVRNYLRQNIRYNDQIAAPPDNIEPIHYTLFISQEGYCNYYASAMAMMLRAQGVPARIVQGYAQGEYFPDDGFYRVRADNAHTWVEVFFPAFGWIQFEPTASLPTVDRPLGAGGGDGFDDPLNSAEDEMTELTDEELAALFGEEPLGFDPEGEGSDLDLVDPEAATGWPVWVYQALIGTFILGLAYLGFIVVDRANRRVESDLDGSFGRLSSWSRWMGLNPRPSETPYERASVLASAVPEGERSIFNLTHHYVLRKFSRQRENPFFSALVEWRQLRPLLLRSTISRRFGLLGERLRRLVFRRSSLDR